MLEHSTSTSTFAEDLDNGGGMAAAVLAVLLVALTTYGRRRLRRHPTVRSSTWGVFSVFLLLCSATLSRLKWATSEHNRDVQNMWTLLLWLVLVLTVNGNANLATETVTAAASWPAEVDAIVSGYVVNLAAYAWLHYFIRQCVPVALNRAIFLILFMSALGVAKLVLKLAAFHSARGSFALGEENARLIAGYMKQLVTDDGGGGGREEQVPRYIVMGEKEKHLDHSRPSYRVKSDVLQDESSGLVTLDRVWRPAEDGHGILADADIRDLCLSYYLFKILRLRLLSGRHPPADAGSSDDEALSFVLSGMDSAGGGTVNADADRVFRILADELWFASDFCYSPIPLCIMGGWCATLLSYICSLLIIVAAVVVGCFGDQDKGVTSCKAIITYSLLLTVVLVEAWEVVAGVCSGWTKMALLGHYITHQSTWLWRPSSCVVHAALTAVLRLRPVRLWPDKLGQKSPLDGSSWLMKSVRVPPSVRDAVLRSLVSRYGGGASKDDSAAARRVVGGKVYWAMYGSNADGRRSRSRTELILVWHVATRLFEMKSTPTTPSASPDMTAACHLSYYCAYLVAAAPELLPDNEEWTRERYKEVCADVRAALGGGGGESTAERYERLLAALSEDSRDTVLRRGAELGRHLVEDYGAGEDEASAWRILADFWSEMLLFVAPSENAEGHVQAMERGGEFITLVWALLLHAGVTTRPPYTPGGGDIP